MPQLTWTDDSPATITDQAVGPSLTLTTGAGENTVVEGGINSFVIYSAAGHPIAVSTLFTGCASGGPVSYEIHANVTNATHF